MKINLVSASNLTFGRSYNLKNEKSKDVTISNSIGNSNLPNYLATSSLMLPAINRVAFKGIPNEKFETKSNNNSYIEQLKNAEKELEVLKNPENNPILEKAQKEHDYVIWFENNRDSLYLSAVKNANAAKSRWVKQTNLIVRIFSSGGDRAYNEVMNRDYYNKKSKYSDYQKRDENNKLIIKNAKISEDARLQRIEDLNQLIANLKKLIDYRGLSDEVSAMLNSKGGVNDRIAGYRDIKQVIELFVSRLNASVENDNIDVESCVVLYGAPGTGKSTFLKAVKAMSNDNVEVVRFDSDDKEPFLKRLKKAMDDAKARYLNEGKRTILLMDDAEKYFAMSVAEAQTHYKKEFDHDDFERLKAINASEANKDVKVLKSILDDIAKAPSENDEDTSYKSGISIFITTNHPNLFDRQLIKRFEKMNAYHVGPAEGDNLKDVLRFYFDDKVKVLEKLKMFKDRDDYEDAIRGLSGIPEEAKDTLIELFEKKKIDILNIDAEDFDYAMLAEDIAPNEEEGAYSNAMIKNIALAAFRKYLIDPSDSYATYLLDEFENTQRDIEPQRYKRYLETTGFVNLFKTQKKYNYNDMLDFANMLKKLNANLLRAKTKKEFEIYLQSLKDRYIALGEKYNEGIASFNEQEEYKQLRVQMDLVENPDKVRQFITEAKQAKLQKAKEEDEE